jgi:hypothetical protein
MLILNSHLLIFYILILAVSSFDFELSMSDVIFLRELIIFDKFSTSLLSDTVALCLDYINIAKRWPERILIRFRYNLCS